MEIQEKKELAKKIIALLENVNVRDWEKIRNTIDFRYEMIKMQSNFTCDKVTLNRIEQWI